MDKDQVQLLKREKSNPSLGLLSGIPWGQGEFGTNLAGIVSPLISKAVGSFIPQ